MGLAHVLGDPCPGVRGPAVVQSVLSERESPSQRDRGTSPIGSSAYFPAEPRSGPDVE